MIYKEETFDKNSQKNNNINSNLDFNDNNVFMSLIECVEFYRKLNEKYLDLNNKLILSCYLNVMKENEINKIKDNINNIQNDFLGYHANLKLKIKENKNN
jgi:hypothetical protein